MINFQSGLALFKNFENLKVLQNFQNKLREKKFARNFAKGFSHYNKETLGNYRATIGDYRETIGRLQGARAAGRR